MQLGSATIISLARMICGDLPFNYMPYRSSSSLTAFFESVNMDYVHDGTTRVWWVRSVLEELNKKPSSDELISKDLIKVIEYLLDLNHFIGDMFDRDKAIIQVNEVLGQYELEVKIDARTKRIRLITALFEFASTATDEMKAEKRISFAPLIFQIPEADLKQDLVSVMMPFASGFNGVFEAIKNACKENSLVCYRADDIWDNSTFIQDIFDLIYCSRIVVVDFSGRNPNVMYETGIAHTLGKIVIPITQSIDDIPSDLKPHRALKYLPNNEGLSELTKCLGKRLSTISEGHSWYQKPGLGVV